MIITSHIKDNKNRAVIISNSGEKILERAKTLPDEFVKIHFLIFRVMDERQEKTNAKSKYI